MQLFEAASVQYLCLSSLPSQPGSLAILDWIHSPIGRRRVPLPLYSRCAYTLRVALRLRLHTLTLTIDYCTRLSHFVSSLVVSLVSIFLYGYALLPVLSAAASVHCLLYLPTLQTPGECRHILTEEQKRFCTVILPRPAIIVRCYCHTIQV